MAKGRSGKRAELPKTKKRAPNSVIMMHIYYAFCAILLGNAKK